MSAKMINQLYVGAPVRLTDSRWREFRNQVGVVTDIFEDRIYARWPLVLHSGGCDIWLHEPDQLEVYLPTVEIIE